jgi:hypothetical protein
MRSKKSQMEIMGLAIVVVLIIIGLLFSIKFVLFKQPSTYREDYTTTQLAANTINTLLKTNTECNEISIKELLQDASKTYQSITCPGTVTSTFFVNLTITNLLYDYLDDLGKEYYFRASVPGKTVVTAGKELTNRERERKTQFLTTDVGVMTIILDIYG